MVYNFHLNKRGERKKGMRGKRLLMAVLLFLAQAKAHAQRDSTTQSGYVSIDYNNDTFTYTDRYYTHGFRVELSRQSFAKLPTRYFLLRLPQSNNNFYGFSLVQDAFTPSSLKSYKRLYADRPYAAYNYAGFFLVSENTKRRLRVSTELDVGIIGPWAGGYQVQAGFHRMIGDKFPQGWGQQIGNNLVLNYGLMMEKALLANNFADITAYSHFNAGTLRSNAVSGVELRAGQVGAWSYKQTGKWQAYLLLSAQIKAVGYDATLQGGVISRNNPYTLQPELMERLIPGTQAGIVLSYRNTRIIYSYVYQGKELKYGLPHKWGHIGLRFGM